MFYERLKRVCELQGTTITSVVRAVGGSIGSVDGWKKGRVPVSDIVVRLATHLDTSTDYLLGKTEIIEPISPNMRALSAEETRFFDALHRALPPVRTAVIRMAEAALSPQNDAQLSEVAGPSFLSENDDLIRPESKRKTARGKKRVEGEAAAGVPIAAVPEDAMTASVPIKYMSDRYFIVRAKGDSMTDAGIESGDFCIFDKDAYFDEGDIMLVQVGTFADESDVTIKSVHFHDDEVELRSANPAYSPMFYPASEVRLMGVFVHIVTPEMD